MVIGIRREDKNEWEARAPFSPQDVAELIKKLGIKFIVQPSPIRVFKDEEYQLAGAEIKEDLSECDIIFAVKEIPPHLLLPDKIYVFFSHTIKGQKSNMPMLKRLIDLKDTLIDYEKIVDESGRRLVFFGRFAGIAGMIDTLWALGRRLEKRGFNTPFRKIKQALEYSSVQDAKEKIASISAEIKERGIPEELVPMVFGFTGYGNVSKGAQEIFNILPFEEIKPSELSDFINSGKFSNQKLYKVVFKEEDMVTLVQHGVNFDLIDYYQHPEKYISCFENYLPYLTVLVNCIYWDARYPRLVTKNFLKESYMRRSLDKLLVIGDISCDVEGSIECTVTTTTPGNPIYIYEPLTGEIKYGVEGDGPVILAVDNLPCELSRDSSEVFSSVLKQFVPVLVQANYPESFEDFNIIPELKRATILYKGKLTPDYQYLERYLQF